MCAARNHALSNATGSIIAYLDDDNIMDPGWLATLAWVFSERPDVDVAYGGLRHRRHAPRPRSGVGLTPAAVPARLGSPGRC